MAVMQRLSKQAVYADEHLLVLDKPAGLLCVPGRGADKQDCLSVRVQQVYPDALVVHRLDMATSGLWLMARGSRAQRALGEAFAQRQVSKRYVAVVAGCPGTSLPPDQWELIDLPIAADWPNRPRRIIQLERGKPSQTRWRVLAYDEQADVTRVALEPLTGRSHQLRVHLQALGHPILGDALYAPPEIQARAPRLLLHATELQFAHPVTGATMAFSSPAAF
jgi:tRNA pseudouridine32 synthase / 23S rRNA pseudouridine746 synthase